MHEFESKELLEAIERMMRAHHQSIHDQLNHVKELLMSLTPEVQALVDAVAAQGVQIGASDAAMVSLESEVAALQAQIAALPATGASAEDVAAIVSATATVVASVDTLKSVMPQPVAAPVVAAATADQPAP